MSDDLHRRLEREGLLFIGAMGAGISHELSNVLNIINELSGLQQDIVNAAAQGATAGLARVADLATRIKSQVIRGEEINGCLHRLAHSVDNDDTTYDLGDNLALFGLLTARAARLAEVELTVRPLESPVALRGDPFALLLTLHSCATTAIKAAASERRVEVWVEARPDGVRVIVSSADPVPELKSDTSMAADLAFGRAALATAPRLEPIPGGGHHIILTLDVETEAAASGV